VGWRRKKQGGKANPILVSNHPPPNPPPHPLREMEGILRQSSGTFCLRALLLPTALINLFPTALGGSRPSAGGSGGAEGPQAVLVPGSTSLWAQSSLCCLRPKPSS
jgi:hypothetical protein